MTGFKGTRNVNGRPKGALNKTSSQTKKIIENIVSCELENIDSLLEKLEPKDRVDALIKLLPYVVARKTQIEIEKNDIDPFRPITINLINEPLKLEQ